MKDPRIRAVFLFFIALTFGVLIFGGFMINRSKSPIPLRTVSLFGEDVFTKEDILLGQNLYFIPGGQHIGTIWIARS